MAETESLNYLYTIGGYAALAGVGYALYQVSTTKGRERAAAANRAKSSKQSQPEPRKEEKKKKQRMDSFTSETQVAEKAKAKAAKATEAAAKAADSISSSTNDKSSSATDDGVDNREFAKQLSKAKQGTQFATNNDSGKKKQKEKSVKQSRANQINPPAQKEVLPLTSPSSGDGAEADDDQTPARSPAAEPTDASGVADMLEPATAAPSVLRLTDTESKNNKKKAAKAPEVVETKKQRQNRKKAEAAKAAREDAEQERKALEEKQRRAARVAEGRAAKDGSQFTAAAVKNSAWNQGSPNAGQAQEAKTNGNHQLLDTFDGPAAAPAPAKPAAAPKTESNWASSLPSEEEQLQQLKDDADEWSTVKTKASKKAKKDFSAGSGDDAPVQAPAAPEAKKSAPAPRANNNTNASSSQKFGAFSALEVKGEPAEEVEEEWDV